MWDFGAVTEMVKNITQLLVHSSQGDKEAMEALIPLVYAELRALARGYLSRERSSHTLQPTALVHEAYFRLIDQNVAKWENRSHFYGVAAQLMRRILVDHARKHRAEKRGGKEIRVEFDEALQAANPDGNPDWVALDDAMKELAKLSPRQSKIVELRYFGGWGIEETAEAMNLSPATVKREWTLARAFLLKTLREGF